MYGDGVLPAADPAFVVVYLGLVVFVSGQHFVMTCLTVVRLQLCKPKGPATADYSVAAVGTWSADDNVTAVGTWSADDNVAAVGTWSADDNVTADSALSGAG